MEKEYEAGDIFKNKITGDKVIVLGVLPKAVKVPGESPNWHADDFIDVTNNERWEFVENNTDIIESAWLEEYKRF